MIKRLISSIKLTLRILKNLLLHPFRTLRNRFYYFFNVGRLVNKFPAAAKKLPKILKTKPEKREDYFDWGSVYVAKLLVLIVLLLLIIIPLLIIFVIYPLCVSWWGVKEFWVEDEALDTYSGRVLVYYDDETFKQLQFEGRLKKGDRIEYGEVYYENGRISFAGDFTEDKREGEGIEYFEDGSVRYRGGFSNDRYNGEGELTAEDGLTYKGTFVNGKLSGKCKIFDDETLKYEGDYADDGINGEGKMYYPNGTVSKSGSFESGLLEGAGMEYFEDGTLRYAGDFVRDIYHGTGMLYDEDGKKLYAGAFEKGLYNGDGTQFGKDGIITEGSFTDGILTGIAVRTWPNGMKYEGSFSDDLMDGAGILTDLIGTFSYRGAFVDDEIDFGTLMTQDIADVNAAFSEQLKMQMAEECFYLESTPYKLTMKCDFAEGDEPAHVAEIAALPVLTEGMIIRSVKDIIAPKAISVGESREVLPDWVAEKYRLDAYSLTCYEAEYQYAKIYYWVDPETGELLLKTAKSLVVREDTSSEDDQADGLSRKEIIDLFLEVGLDIKDFASLGF